LIEELVHTQIHGTGYGLELRQKMGREGVIGFHIRS